MALGLACVLEDAALLLCTLWAPAAGAERDSTVTDRDAGEKTEDASIDAIAASLEPAAAASAVVVENEPKEIAWNSWTGASTTGD
jgi:hypothetical protein